jgi:hypothetical protein
MKFNQAFKEEIKVSFENLKGQGKDIGLDFLEEIAEEIVKCIGRTVVKSENKADDLYKLIEGQLLESVDKIDGKDDI